MSGSGKYPARRLPKSERIDQWDELVGTQRWSEKLRRQEDQRRRRDHSRECKMSNCDRGIDTAPELIALHMCLDCITAASEGLEAYHQRLRSVHRDELQAKADARKAELAAQKNGTIYYVQVGEHLKIGWTRDLDERMRAYPPNTVLLAAHPGTQDEELKLHKRFALHRSHGREWYTLDALQTQVDSVRRKYGEPKAVQFSAAPATTPTPHRQREYTNLRRRSRRTG